MKTAFHEIAHVLLHPKTVSTDSDNLTRDLKECEAELTSYRVCSSLDHTANLSSSRVYIQNWRADDTVEKIRYGKVFSAADSILKAGRIEPDRPAVPSAKAPGLVA